MAPDSFMGPGYRQEITHNCADGRGVYIIPVQNQTSFTVEFTVTKDANEDANNQHCILLGILSSTDINEDSAFDADDDLPQQGYFLDDLLYRFGGDKTGLPVEIRNSRPTLCISKENTFRLSLVCQPYLHLCGQIRHGQEDISFPIEFTTIQANDYTPIIWIPKGKGVWCVEVEEVDTCIPWHSGWSLSKACSVAQNYVDVAFVLKDLAGSVVEKYAHKVVLATQSATLNKLFLEQGREFVRVYVPRVMSVSAMETFLEYLYTKKFMSGHAYTNHLKDVLFLAYYYQVEELFYTCAIEILKGPCSETIFQAFSMVQELRLLGLPGETRSSMTDWLFIQLNKYLEGDADRLRRFLANVYSLSH